MNYEVWLPIVISGLSLLASGYTIFISFLAKFNGQIATSNHLSFISLNKVPSLGISIFLQNDGAKAGRLDDLRLRVSQVDTKTNYIFFPQLMADNYGAFIPFEKVKWQEFSPIQIQPNSFPFQYILFKPKNDNFYPSKGIMEVQIEVKWSTKKKWKKIKPPMKFTLTDEAANLWKIPDHQSFSIMSEEAVQIRGLE